MTRGKAESFEQSAFAQDEQITQEILLEIETVRPELAEILGKVVRSELDHLTAMVAPDEAAYALAVVGRVLGRRGFFLNDAGAS